ncbi:MAG: DUF2203 family protein [Myxococcales bacterium]|nr:DUF2203 family protein [Myxococcales bacterium]
MSDERRRWSLETARALLPEVRARTERAVREFEALDAERRALAERSGAEASDDADEAGDDAAPAADEDAFDAGDERARVEARLRACISRWVREMEALGLEVKGAWLVDFDNGSGYYCWRWPEHDVAHFHGYDEGFASRVRIQ